MGHWSSEIYEEDRLTLCVGFASEQLSAFKMPPRAEDHPEVPTKIKSLIFVPAHFTRSNTHNAAVVGPIPIISPSQDHL